MHISLAFVLVIASVAWADDVESITGGDEVDKQEFPNVVWLSMFKNHKTNGANRCTGSLIDEQWVLTSAGCFLARDYNIGTARMPWVGLGDHDITQPGDREQVVKASLVIVHPNAERYKDDIALVKLALPAKTFKKSIDVVEQLGTKSMLLRVKREQPMCYTVGWGAEQTLTGGWRYPTTLQKLQVKINKDEEYCTKYFDGYRLSNQICSESVSKKGARCFYGDKGAPTMCWVGEKWVQIGIFSTQQVYDGCLGGIDLDTNIARYRSWIKKTIRQNS